MKFIENNTYTLQTDKGLAPYNSVKVVCTYVEDNTVWLAQQSPFSFAGNLSEYKLDRKTGKLYKWDCKFPGWEAIENTLSEETVEDVWSKRMGNSSDYYSGIGQD